MLARVFKDIFPRYKTMCGYYVERKGGWDCHGLPVELAVEAELGFTQKDDIERYGIAEFNALCREKVLSHVQDWNRLTERIGFWIDLDDAYRTLDPSYIESVWWALKTIHDRGLLFERLKVVPYCTRDGTALSSHELGQPDVYRDVDDPSVYVRFPVTIASPAVRKGDNLLVWTTTPWTLVSNAAVAVDPISTYVRGADRRLRRCSCSPRRCSSACSAPARRCSTGSRDGSSRAPGMTRRSRSSPARSTDRAVTRCCSATSSPPRTAPASSTRAIAFGEDDFRLGEQYGLNVVNPVRTDGTYDERIGPYAGRCVKDADPDLVEDLRARGMLVRVRDVPRTPIRTAGAAARRSSTRPSPRGSSARARSRTVCSRDNETIGWHPEHVKHGRFGKWLENNVDWALSRERYWGTPLPVWRCAARPHARRRLVRRARATVRRAARGSAPSVRRRRGVPVPRVRRGDAPHA